MDKYLLWCEVLGTDDVESFFAMYETEAEALAEMKTELLVFEKKHGIADDTTEFYFSTNRKVFTQEADGIDGTHINIDVRPVILKNKYCYMR